MSSGFRVKENIILLAAFAFLIVGTFGLGTFGMNMGTDGHMSGCPFMGKTAVCNMSPLEHMATLQNMLAATPQQSGTFALLLLLLSMGFLSFFSFSIAVFGTEQGYHFIRYLRREPRAFDPLRLAFARGIIHPKVF